MTDLVEDEHFDKCINKNISVYVDSLNYDTNFEALMYLILY